MDRTRASSSAPSAPLGPPTITSAGPGVAQRGQRLHGDVDALERLDPAYEQERRPVGETQAAPGGGRSPGEKAEWSTPAGMTSTRSGSAS